MPRTVSFSPYASADVDIKSYVIWTLYCTPYTLGFFQAFSVNELREENFMKILDSRANSSLRTNENLKSSKFKNSKDIEKVKKSEEWLKKKLWKCELTSCVFMCILSMPGPLKLLKQISHCGCFLQLACKYNKFVSFIFLLRSYFFQKKNPFFCFYFDPVWMGFHMRL